MPIRVICPSCGRVGQGPEHAIGRVVQCPACLHRHRLTADGVASQEADEPAPRPAAAARPRPKAAADEAYDLRPHADAPPRRPVAPERAARPARASDRPDHSGGLKLPVPVLVGGACGVALLSVLAAVAGIRTFGGGQDAKPAAADAAPKPATPPAVAAAPGTPPATVPAASLPAAPAVAGAPMAPPALAAPGQISVAEAMQIADEAPPVAPTVAAVPAMPAPAAAPTPTPTPATPAPAPAPARGLPVAEAPPAVDNSDPDEPAGESNVAAQARAAATAAASRDDGAGKTLTTAEIVAESEPSVALIKGKGSSGTGFLVGPGLLATNAHVIDDEFIPDLEVRFVSADEGHKAPLKAELLYEDAERDLAFLAVKTDLKPLRVAKTYAFRKGEDITVIGNPGLGDGQVLENAISRGVMSTKTQIDQQNFYQLGIAINPGNSGGPVFDSAGRVIGVATLKSSKQEATGFSIPIEDLQLALAKMAKESSGDANRYRSRHRIQCAVKGLGSGGALICIVIDLRRAAAVSNNAQVKEALDKLEPIVTELNKELFPSLVVHAPRVKNDPLLASQVKSKAVELSQNFVRIRDAYSSGRNVDDNQLRTWKQTHRRLLTELAASLKLDVPSGLMVAFEDHAPAQPTTIVTVGPQGLGSYGSRLRQRYSARTPGGLSRPPSLRDRMAPRGRLR